MFFRSGVGAVSAALLLAALGAGGAPSEEPASDVVRVAVSRTPLSTPLYVAEFRDEFRNAGVQVAVEDCVGGHRCLRRLLEGGADLATVSDSPITVQSLVRSDIVVLATFVHSYRDVKLVTRGSAGIVTPADLSGRRIGAVVGTSSEFFLDTFLTFYGIPASAVDVVPIEPEAMPEALAIGTVDAIAVWEPFGFLARKRVDDAMVLEHTPVYRETFNLVALRSWVDSNPGAAVAVLRAIDRAMAYIHHEGAGARGILADWLALDPSLLDALWPEFVFGLSLDQALLVTLEQEAQWQRRRRGEDPSDIPNYLRIIDSRALEAVRPAAVTLVR